MFSVPHPATLLSEKSIVDMGGKMRNLTRIVQFNPKSCLPEAQPLISQLYIYFEYVFTYANFPSTEETRFKMQSSLQQIRVLESELIRVVNQ